MKMAVEPVEARGDASEMLELVEAPLHEIPLLVDFLVIADGALAIARRRDHQAHPPCATNQVTEGPAGRRVPWGGRAASNVPVISQPGSFEHRPPVAEDFLGRPIKGG